MIKENKYVCKFNKDLDVYICIIFIVHVVGLQVSKILLQNYNSLRNEKKNRQTKVKHTFLPL